MRRHQQTGVAGLPAPLRDRCPKPWCEFMLVFAWVHVQVESLGAQVVRRVPVHTCAYIDFRAFTGENHGTWDDTMCENGTSL